MIVLGLLLGGMAVVSLWAGVLIFLTWRDERRKRLIEARARQSQVFYTGIENANRKKRCGHCKSRF